MSFMWAIPCPVVGAHRRSRNRSASRAFQLRPRLQSVHIGLIGKAAVAPLARHLEQNAGTDEAVTGEVEIY
jgi:hypothetical protein